MTQKENNTDLLITHILEGIDDIKGNDIQLLDLRKIDNTVCDYFIVCSGTSNTQVKAIASSVSKTVSKALHEKPWHTEGTDNAEWILMDYVHVVVHIFQQHAREFYDIEGLWGDAKTTLIDSKNPH